MNKIYSCEECGSKTLIILDNGDGTIDLDCENCDLSVCAMKNELE